MDFLKLLQSLEDLVFEVALWLLLLPRTLFAAVFMPVTLANHFDEMQATPAAERNELYLSPILFWVLLAPSTLIIAIIRMGGKLIEKYGATWQEQLATGTLMLLGPPLGFALGSILVRREGVSRKSLRRHFSLQCYFHAPAFVVFLLVWALQQYLMGKFGEDVTSVVVGPLVFLPFGWFLITQYRIAARETEPVRAGGSVALGCGLGFLVFLGVVFVVGLVLHLLGRVNLFEE